MTKASKTQKTQHMFIRQAQVNDAAAIARVHVDGWRTTYVGIVPQKYLESLSHKKRTAEWQSFLSDSTSSWFTYVTEDGSGNIVGFARSGPERNGNKVFTSELGAIYLLKSHQRLGIGHMLIAKVAQRLMQQGHCSMLLWVLAANPYRPFYEALGGKVIGEKETTIGGVNVAGVAYGWQDIEVLARQLPANPSA